MHDHPHDHTHHTPEALNPRRAMLAGLGGLAAGAFLASTTNAGPLTPPPGPIQSTPGPEPRIPVNAQNTPGDANNTFRITQPGAYYLTGNLQGVSGRSGISIEAGNVTLDLMGFQLRGVAGSIDGITMANWRNSVVIRNGAVSSWGETGVRARIDNGAIEHIHVSNNGGWGILHTGGFSFRIHACSAISNGSAVPNTGGIFAQEAVTVTDCQARSNSSHGISVGSACTVTNCVAIQNGVSGINVSSNSIVRGNVCRAQVSGIGIRIDSIRNRIEDNSCTANMIGIATLNPSAVSNFIARNTCSGNTTNWEIVSNNKCLVINGVNAPSIVGNSGGTSPGSTNPNANYTI